MALQRLKKKKQSGKLTRPYMIAKHVVIYILMSYEQLDITEDRFFPNSYY